MTYSQVRGFNLGVISVSDKSEFVLVEFDESKWMDNFRNGFFDLVYVWLHWASGVNTKDDLESEEFVFLEEIDGFFIQYEWFLVKVF